LLISRPISDPLTRDVQRGRCRVHGDGVRRVDILAEVRSCAPHEVRLSATRIAGIHNLVDLFLTNHGGEEDKVSFIPSPPCIANT
jgi:hypothetical protein